MKLYQLQAAGNSRKVRAVAAELSIELELIDINPSAGEQRAPEYLKMNPNGKVPLLVDGEFCLWKSHAIMIYLARLKPEHNLLPADPKAEVDVLRWLFWQTAHLGPAIGKMASEKIYKPRAGKPFDQQNYDAGMDEFKRFGAVLELDLGGRDTICAKLSLADFSLAATFSARNILGLDLSQYPNISHWLKYIESRESWAKSAPLVLTA